MILIAASRVFAEHGYDQGTTQRVAEVAGVSVGTLYQYFPNKASLLAALAERELERFFTLFEQCLAGAQATDFENVLRMYVETVLAVYREEPLQHVLVESFTRTRDLALSNEHDRRAYEIVRAFLEKHHERLRVARADIAAYLVVTSVRYATLCWARDQPEFDRGQFIDELCDMVIGYLLGGRDDRVIRTR